MVTDTVFEDRGLVDRSAARAHALRPDVDDLGLSPNEELALLARALYREGWNDFNVGHITYRMPDDTFLTLPKQRGWDEVRPEDMLRIDIDGNIVEGRGDVTSAIILHLEFHRLRHDCNITIHQHPQYTTIWSAAGRVPPAYDQRSAWLADSDFAFYDDYQGGVNDMRSARAAVEALGDRCCAILRNHGAFVVAETISQAFFRATTLEWRCKQAWHAEAIGATNVMPQAGRDWLAAAFKALPGSTMATQWPWAVRRELRADPTLMQ